MAAKFLLLDGKNVSSLLSMSECINVLRHALRSLSSADGKTLNPLRQQLWLPNKQGGIVSMPACVCLPDEDGEERTFLGMKALSIFPHNVDLPSHLGLVLLFDGQNGQMLSMMDATEITGLPLSSVSQTPAALACDPLITAILTRSPLKQGIRTAAASAVATDLLAKQSSTKLAILGVGHQAHTHLQV